MFAKKKPDSTDLVQCDLANSEVTWFERVTHLLIRMVCFELKLRNLCGTLNKRSKNPNMDEF